MKVIYLAGGWFWGTQQYIRQFRGVVETQVGYANGKTPQVTYEEVCHQGTGHAETVRVVFDESVISASALLDRYFLSIDPLSVNRQGGDVGTQYRTGIYYDDDSLYPELSRFLQAKEAELGQKTAVELCPLIHFCPAEEYHQDYLIKNPGGYCHIPKRLLEMES